MAPVLTPRAMLRFRHADAVTQAKERPGTVAGAPSSGHYPLFYGSTFKGGGSPRGAILVDPWAAPGENARQLAEHLGKAIDEPTYFHGSMMSETHSADSSVTAYPGVRFPGEHFDTLCEQGEDTLLAFSEAWRRLAWLSAKHRAIVLDMLWWQLQPEPHEELALTLWLCDGLGPGQIAGLGGSTSTHEVALLPRSRAMVQRLSSELPFDSEDAVRALLEREWKKICQRAKRAGVHLPDWSRVPASSS